MLIFLVAAVVAGFLGISVVFSESNLVLKLQCTCFRFEFLV